MGSIRFLEELGELKQLCVLLRTGSVSGQRAGTNGMGGEEGFHGSLANMAPLFLRQAATESFLSEINGSALGETYYPGIIHCIF